MGQRSKADECEVAYGNLKRNCIAAHAIILSASGYRSSLYIVVASLYADHSPDDTLIPAAVETFGCLGAPFQDLLRMCARRARRRESEMRVCLAERRLDYHVITSSAFHARSVCNAVRHDRFITDQLEPYIAHWELHL
jgi:hypothetical protein